NGMAPSYTSAAQVLPPLQQVCFHLLPCLSYILNGSQVIPEFHSAVPSHRNSGEHSSSLDPRLSDRYSPPNPPSRHFPGPPHGFDSGVRMTPSPTRRMEPAYGNGPVGMIHFQNNHWHCRVEC